jgi:hypothetical protein
MLLSYQASTNYWSNISSTNSDALIDTNAISVTKLVKNATASSIKFLVSDNGSGNTWDYITTSN